MSKKDINKKQQEENTLIIRGIELPSEDFLSPLVPCLRNLEIYENQDPNIDLIKYKSGIVTSFIKSELTLSVNRCITNLLCNLLNSFTGKLDRMELQLNSAIHQITLPTTDFLIDNCAELILKLYDEDNCRNTTQFEINRSIALDHLGTLMYEESLRIVGHLMTLIMASNVMYGNDDIKCTDDMAISLSFNTSALFRNDIKMILNYFTYLISNI